MRNDLSLARDGAIYWNSARISKQRLNQYLGVSHDMNPEPLLFLQTEMGVSCRALEELRDQIDRAMECKKPYSQCAEGNKEVWRRLPTPAGTPPS